jgi:cytochrome c oxidase cbb3-type subunit 4
VSVLGFGIAGAVGTVLAMTAFLAVVAWAWSGRRKADFDAASQLPLEEDAGRDRTSGVHR